MRAFGREVLFGKEVVMSQDIADIQGRRCSEQLHCARRCGSDLLVLFAAILADGLQRLARCCALRRVLAARLDVPR